MSRTILGSLRYIAAVAILASPIVSVAADQCALVFSQGPFAKTRLPDPAKIRELRDGLSVKKTTRLDEVTQKLRRYILESGEVDTTKLRSEFKHYIEASKTDAMIEQLKAEFPPVYDITGKLISGITSRDNLVKVKPAKLDSALGKNAIEKLKAEGLLGALQLPEVYAQHKSEVHVRILNSFEMNEAQTIIRKTEQLQSEAAVEVASRGRKVYTDTSSTSKFAYKSGVSRDAVLESASSFGLTLKDKEIDAITRIDFFNLSDAAKISTAKKLTQLGIEKEIANNFVADLAERSSDEGVIRYRKYRTGPENLSFEGIPSPASILKSTHALIKDAPFADGVTWLEFKMKNSSGEATRQTVVNKPRFPLRDEQIAVLKDASKFLSPDQFGKTKEMVKAEIRETITKLQTQGVKEAKWNEAEVDAAIDFIRALHLQGHSLEPAGRTVYMRDSYNLNLVDANAKSQNIQITRDRHVWELDRSKGQMLQGLPWVEPKQGWQFQFNARSGWYEHKGATGKLEHVFNPRFPDVVYEVQGDRKAQIEAKLEPVEVVELKIPVAFIRLSKAEITELPALRNIVDLRKKMVAATEELNSRRAEVGLAPFKVDKGKRSTSRGDVSGGIKLMVHPRGLPSAAGSKELVAREFKFNPETGFWVNWSEGADLVYHPALGVLRLVGEQNVTSVPVFYREMQ